MGSGAGGTILGAGGLGISGTGGTGGAGAGGNGLVGGGVGIASGSGCGDCKEVHPASSKTSAPIRKCARINAKRAVRKG